MNGHVISTVVYDPFTAHKIADTLRLYCFIGGVWCGAYTGRLALIVRNTRQWGLWAMVLLLCSVIYTEFNRLGYPVTVRLYINTGAILLMTVFLVKTFSARHNADSKDEMKKYYPNEAPASIWWKRLWHAIKR